MFSFWNRTAKNPALKNRYRPVLEDLERRETPAAGINIGPNINISQAGGNQREQSIVVNPVNPKQVVAFSNIENLTDGLFEAWSSDGGATWNTQYLFTDATQPDAACCDPQAAWDRFGNLFLAYLTTSGDIAVAHSIDGGQSFSVSFLTFDGATLGNDQPSIAVGPGPKSNLGTVWVSYNHTIIDPTLAGIQTQSAIVAGYGLVGPFSNPVLVPGSDMVGGNFGDIAVGPDGEAIVTYGNVTGPPDGPGVIFVNIDPDGRGPKPWGPRRAVTSTNVGPFRRPTAPLVFPAQSNSLGIDSEPSLAWDRSNGPHRGRVYLVYTDANSTVETDFDTDIYLRYSDNNGRTWSKRILVNDDTGTASQFNPAIAVDQSTGNVAISWYDTRNDGGANRLAEMWATLSYNGGVSFQTNFKVSDGQSDSQLADIAPIGGRALGYGDYNKIDFVKGNLQIIWADNSAELPFNPDPTRMDLATVRIRVAPALKVRVYFPARWIQTARGIYSGTITVLNTSGGTLRGPIQLSIVVPHSSLNFLSPANTRVGNRVTFTINRNLANNVPLRFNAILSNPLKLRLPTFLTGFATSLA